MKVVFDPLLLVPVLTASTSNGVNTPERGADGDTTTFWESTSETDPYIQIDLTKILKVYRIEITWDSVNVPSNFRIMSTDAPTDSTYGLDSGAFDFVLQNQAGSANTTTAHVFDAKSARHWRIQMVGAGQMRIKEIAVYASSAAPSTSARAKIGVTYFTEQTNRLLGLKVGQAVTKMLWDCVIRLDNKNQILTADSYPNGTEVKTWLEGKVSFLGIIANNTFEFGKEGLGLIFDCRDYGEFLNQQERQAWGGTPISSLSATNDILSKGPYSLLGMTINSAGVRVIGNSGVQNALHGVNTVSYLKMPDIDKKLLLETLIEKVAIDGAWVIQNPGFDTGAVQPANIGNKGTTDGFWFGRTVNESASFSVNLRDNNVGTLDIRNAIQGGSTVTALDNGTGAYDGNVNKDSSLVYVEIFQPIFVAISQCSQASSFRWTALPGAQSTQTGGSGTEAEFRQINDMIVETASPVGQVRRLHYADVPSFYSLPADTDTDKYIAAGGTATRNLYSDYTGKFGTATDDVVTTIRYRVLPFVGAGFGVGGANKRVNVITIDDITIFPVAHVKVPPVKFDFYVDPSDGTPQLAFFPRPRPGIDLTYRHLDASNTLRWFRTFPASDKNNIQTFRLTHSDAYRVKNDVSTSGTQATPPIDSDSGSPILADSPEYLTRSVPPHGSRVPVVQLFDTQAMTATGRRTARGSIGSSDPVAVARESINKLSSLRDLEQRGIVVCRGNPNLQPGFVVRIESDLSVLNGYFYITNADHNWDINGYTTTITIAEDRLRFSNEFARLQVNILNAQLKNPLADISQDEDFRWVKRNANMYLVSAPTSSVATTNSVMEAFQAGGTGALQSGVSFPLNAVPEFSLVKSLTVISSKTLDRKGYGQVGPIGFAGWDTNQAIQTGADGEATLNSIVWLGQRFQTSANSAGAIIFQFAVRRPNSVGAENYLAAGIYTDAGKPATQIPAIDTDGLPAPEGWIQLPFSKIIQGGTDAPSTGTDTLAFHYLEFKLASPLQPSTKYWFVVRVASAGGNLYMKRFDTGVSQTLYRAHTTDGGVTWVTDNNQQFTTEFRQTKALSFVPAPQQGATVGWSMFDPITGLQYKPTSPTGFDQTQATLSFPTATIARLNSVGDVYVAFPSSVATGSGTQNIARHDYIGQAKVVRF